jgi:preprotein translocase subunit SecE
MQWPEESRAFLSEVQVELKKVTWPTQRETVAGTVSVVVLVLIMGSVLTGVDWTLSWGMRMIWP